ncbi:Thioredoxin reductase [Desulfocicer vacuolatum DSM 3385]|uniref:Thioredoxin reductase n=1 Tax=Desulfocicer vacuolatum DSM 3385 TaxID=1121400 RepID=A0A1W2DYL0_9BACT|nr:FAD-dependent oxidoreductase [Desulfocicer vacuolatum]SMD02533.1 Thioredoxin reductase [Desulfocicer vacuolatum DSM 3385]
MSKQRLTKHPVMEVDQGEMVAFSWNKKSLQGIKGEMISSALFANGIQVFGHHTKDHSAQGMFCANGQCSQCLVMADGLPVKSCMTPLTSGMVVESLEGLPRVPGADDPIERKEVEIRAVSVLIIGGGPAGLSAAIELGKLGVDTLIIDDKDRLGGKLVLQTHKFFGSVEDSWAGTRGFEIGHILAREVEIFSTVETWLETTAVGVFSDKVVGVVRKNRYVMIKPQKVLVATGAREKMLPFPGNTLPGVYGAGAFQTLVNRDLIKASERVLIVGGGNVGIIAGYHALQADIEVVAVIEGLPEVGGYKVHADKLKRLGVPIFTRHTVVSANGEERLESVTMAAIDDNWKVIPGTEKTVEVDTLLIAVGLSPVDEFFAKAKEWEMDVYAAGDAQEIAEASAAMFTGKIEGVKIGKALGAYKGDVPREWLDKARVLKSRPGEIKKQPPPLPVPEGVMPVFHCTQEIPCNPCTSICPEHIIKTENDLITGLPHVDDVNKCKGCLNCVAICPGLAVSVVDYRKDTAHPTVTLPYELGRDAVEKGTMITVTDVDGEVIGDYPVQRVVANKKKFPGTLMVQIKMPHELASRAIGIKEQKSPLTSLDIPDLSACPDDAVICRCERITAGEIRAAIRGGVRDMNQLKGLNRTGMGACGSKTCRPMVMGLFRDEGVDLKEVTDGTHRPLFVEVPFGTLAGIKGGK